MLAQSGSRREELAAHTGQSSQLFPDANDRNAKFPPTVARSTLVKRLIKGVSDIRRMTAPGDRGHYSERCLTASARARLAKVSTNPEIEIATGKLTVIRRWKLIGRLYRLPQVVCGNLGQGIAESKSKTKFALN
jgi:hypothetical protein